MTNLPTSYHFIGYAVRCFWFGVKSLIPITGAEYEFGALDKRFCARVLTQQRHIWEGEFGNGISVSGRRPQERSQQEEEQKIETQKQPSTVRQLAFWWENCAASLIWSHDQTILRGPDDAWNARILALIYFIHYNSVFACIPFYLRYPS